MKKITLSLLLFLSLSGFLLQAQSFDSASAYLDFVSAEQQEITKNMWRYTKAMAHDKSDRNVERKRQQLIKSVEKSIDKIEKADTYEGEEYKKQVLNNLTLYKNLLRQDYEKIIDMKAVAEQSYDSMEAYMNAQEMTNEKMTEAQQLYEENFRKYAEAHNINVIEDETDLGKKMKISGEVFDYYNKLYLMFFKVNFNEMYLMEALEKGDVAAIQQNANALKQSAEEGLRAIEETEKYKNDNSLIKSTEKAFKFYIDQVNNTIPEITSFLVLSEDFEKIKKAIDDTPQRKRTKEQIDAYNKKVNEVNKAGENYNKINNDLYENRQVVINQLNKTNEEFLARHIPND
ncbi:LIC11966 family surface protein [Mesonia maritima]|uniref:Uncharacterized protein n=1 Tax=Mesonia maritima TaxID=1793873 RepID=A0ABU1KC39_9FLAO|nr:hypothetical protein [Mesonia maritima]MDR6302143.1 hypothetical protein [Mesonia maritima]